MEYLESSTHMVLEELQLMVARLSKKISSRCEGVEHRIEECYDALHNHFMTTCCDTIQQQVDVAVLRSEEWLLALEMMCSNVEDWKPDLVKRINDVELEVARVN